MHTNKICLYTRIWAPKGVFKLLRRPTCTYIQFVWTNYSCSKQQHRYRTDCEQFQFLFILHNCWHLKQRH